MLTKTGESYMKRLSVLVTLLLTFSAMAVSGESYARDKFTDLTDLTGPYLGQEPPGSTPIAFAPGIVSTDGWEYGGAFTRDMNEFYYIRMNAETEKQEFVVFRHEKNRWNLSVVSPRVGQPFFAPDGKTMHLGRRYMERTEAGWSAIKSLGSPFEDIRIMRLTVSAKGTFVFDEVGSEDGDSIIRYSRLVDGKREEPKPFGAEINTGAFNAHPFIAADESYIIWDGRRDSGFGHSDIYISYRQPDGSWGDAINMGDKINTQAPELAASVTPDGKYLFFHRNVGVDGQSNLDMHWVDAQIIEDLRPE